MGYGVFMNSAHRDAGSNSQPVFFLNVFGANSARSQKLHISSLSVPYDWYNIRAGVNDEFIVNSTTYNLTPGSPSATELVADINAVQSVFTASYDSKTNLITFTQTTGTDTIEPTNCGHLFGLVDGTEYTGTTTSVKPIDMQYVHAVVLHSDMHPGRNYTTSTLQSGVFGTTALLHIPIGSTPPFDRIKYVSSDTCEGTEVQASSTATFWFTDENNNKLTISGDWTLWIQAS